MSDDANASRPVPALKVSVLFVLYLLLYLPPQARQWALRRHLHSLAPAFLALWIFGVTLFGEASGEQQSSVRGLLCDPRDAPLLPLLKVLLLDFVFRRLLARCQRLQKGGRSKDTNNFDGMLMFLLSPLDRAPRWLLPPGGIWKLSLLLIMLAVDPSLSSKPITDALRGLGLTTRETGGEPTPSLPLALLLVLSGVLTLGTGLVLLLWQVWAKRDFSTLQIHQRPPSLPGTAWIALFNGYVEEMLFRGFFTECLFFWFEGFRQEGGSRVDQVHRDMYAGLCQIQGNGTQAMLQEEGSLLEALVHPFVSAWMPAAAESTGSVALASPYHSWFIAWVFQALLFGSIHYYGIPSGVSGVLLTTLYGLLMGWLAALCGGLGVVVVLHALADFVIFWKVVH